MITRLLPIALTVALSGCLQPRPEAPAPECTVSSDCATGKACSAGKCVDACKADVDCAAPAACTGGACVLPAGRCLRSSDCLATETCAAGNVCASKCAAASDCASGQACVAGACTAVSTAIACHFNSECPAAQACVQGTCSKACATDRDCPANSSCTNDFCVPKTPACFSNADCGTGKACAPTGACVAACTTLSQCAASGEACSNGACVAVGPSTATLEGKVALTGVTDASGLAISVSGPNRAGGVTAADGSFKFEGLSAGLYTVTVAAPNTVEKSAKAEVAGKPGATTTVPTFTLTPAGNIAGKVTAQGKTTNEGIQLVTLGAGFGAITATDGSFTISNLPVGTYDLLATTPGFQSARLNAVVVAYGQTATPSPLVLQPAIVGSSFAFTSAPPTSVRIDKPFAYQAQAGGGGVGSVTYALASKPTGAAIDPLTGQVSWKPDGTGTWFFAVAASGGGQLIYQVFDVQVTAATSSLHSNASYRLEVGDGGVFTVGNDVVTWTSASGASIDAGVLVSPTGTITSLEHLNGLAVTKIDWARGSVTGVKGPLGALDAAWDGGTVSALAVLDKRPVQASALVGGTVSQVAYQEGNSVAAVAVPRHLVEAYSDGRTVSTTVTAQTGLVASVTATTLTDSAASFPAAYVTQCVTDATGYGTATITAAAGTTLTLSSDASGFLSPGRRYFVGPCTCATCGKNTVYSVTAPGTPYTVGAAGWYADLYTATQFIANPSVTFTSTSTFTFQSNVTNYASLLAMGSSGFFVLSNNGGGTTATITSSSGAFDTLGLTPSNTRVTFEDTASSWSAPLVSVTPTTLTYRAPFGTLASPRVGKYLVRLDTGDSMTAKVTLATGGLTLNAKSGQYLWFDSMGTALSIASNDPTSVSVRVYRSSLPLPSLVGSPVGYSTYSSYRPTVLVTGTGLTPGAHANRSLFRLTNDATTPYLSSYYQSIDWNDATTLRLPSDYCNGGCVGQLQYLQNQLVGKKWRTGNTNTNRIDFKVTLAGTPNLAPDTLRGRTVVVDGAPASAAVVVSNDATSLVVEVAEASFDAFNGLTTSGAIWLSDLAPGNAAGPMRVQLTSSGASWTAGQWVNTSVVSANGQVAGTVLANTANTVDLGVTNAAALPGLLVGSRFAFAVYSPQANCGSAPSVRLDVTLAGATLVANAYNQLRLSSTSSNLYVGASTTSGATVYACASSFPSVLSSLGKTAVLHKDNAFPLTVEDSAASYVANEYVGKLVYLTTLGSTSSIGRPISSNTPTSLTITDADPGNFLNFSNSGLTSIGATYMVADSNSEVPMTLTVAGPLVPDALAKRFVSLNDGLPQNSSGPGSLPLWVVKNTATTLTVAGTSSGTLNGLVTGGTLNGFRYLSTTAGTLLRLTDNAAAWPVGGLVGETLRLGPVSFTVLSNTATQLTASSADPDDFGKVSSLTTYLIDRGSYRSATATILGGDLLVASNSSSATGDALNRVTPAGQVTRQTMLATAKKVTVSAMPVTAGVFTSSPTSASSAYTWSNPTWNFTPGALAGQYLRFQDSWNDSFSQFNMVAITENTATTITGIGTVWNGYYHPGHLYQLIDPRFTVAGGGLTPGAYKGRTLRLDSVDYVIKDNTATELQVYLPDAFAWSPRALWPNDGPTTGFILDGLPPGGIVGLSSDDAGGSWAATGTELGRFDGTAWTRLGEASLTTKIGQGTLTSSVSSSVITDSAGTYAPGSLVGKRLVVAGLAMTVTANTATQIRVNGSWTNQVPLAGEAYVVLEPLLVGTFTAVGAAGGAVWVGTSSGGVLRRQGTTTTRFTVASTESAPGRADGLGSDEVDGLRVLPGGDVFAMRWYSGVSRFNGTSWKFLSPATTESAPGKNDGLASRNVYDVWREGTGATWFSTSGGASRLSGTTWTTQGPAKGFFGSVYGTWVSPSGDVLFATGYGLIKLLP